MRKISFATLALALGLCFGSCSKEYNCECTTTQGGSEVGSTTTTKEHSSESDAEDWCNGQESESTSNGVTTKTTCELSEA